MSLLTVERIKLTTTRSPWWCTGVAAFIAFGWALLFAALYRGGAPADAPKYSPSLVVSGAANLGLYVIMIMAALSITTEYRFGIIRTTFQAAPRRWQVLSAKAAFVSLVALVLGEVFAFGAIGLARVVNGSPLSLSSSDDWRAVAGVGLIYALAAILAVGVGALLRQSAGAIAILLLFPLLVESLIGLIPKVGSGIQHWMPFLNASNFTGGGGGSTSGFMSPWYSLLYFAAVTAVIFGLAIFVVERRDA